MPPGTDEWRLLERALRSEAATLVAISRALRLTPRSRRDNRSPLKTVVPGRRPWELPVDDAS
jgi:hypothetical protein